MSKQNMDTVVSKLEFEAGNKNVQVEDGHELLKNLKKEARRQEAIKKAEELDKMSRPVEFLPAVESPAEELELAETFEIIEE